ncbi:hypothetical protein GGR54DRAFT_422816 [Hypoxylon sp. NC1633]|nr:hypothetical protein GGR54DRAFT_422816 [Hypoxylon sp. NC1633]
MAELSALPPDQLAAALEGPALKPPDGVDPNFDHPANQNGLAHGILAVCLSLSTIFLLIRLYIRFIYLRKSYIEDYLIMAAYGTFVGYISCGYWQLSFVGFFVHQWDVRLRDMIPLLHLTHCQNYIVGNNLQLTSVGLLKIAILLDWIRLFVPQGIRTTFFWTCQVVLWVNILWHCSMLIAVNLSCIPWESIWNLTVPGKCFDKKSIDVAAAVMALATDVFILILPHRVIWKLHMSLRKKIGVSAVFCLGIFSCVAAAVRLPTVVNFLGSQDILYDYSAVAFWAAAEFTSGMLIFCAPSTPKLVRHLRESTAVASLLSWTGSWGHTNSNMPQSHGSSEQPRWPTAYEQVDDRSAVHLVKLGTAGSGQQVMVDQGERGIIRTTHVATVEDYRSDHSDEGYKRQHPWIEHN